MIEPGTKLRVARPTDNLSLVADMYARGLGFSKLSEFQGHDGFDGVILGHPHHPYHLEFTTHHGHEAGRAPTNDNLLVFYIEDNAAWQHACDQMVAAGFKLVASYNPYWDKAGRTFEDIDGYRVVLENNPWER